MSLWQYTWQKLHETSDLWWQKIWDKCLRFQTPYLKKIFWKLYQTMKSPPAAYGVQLRLQHSLVLLHDVSQRNSHMLPVFTLCAVQTHGCLTWLAVELHHLQRETNWVKIPSLAGLWVSKVIFSVSFTLIVRKGKEHRATLVRWCQSWCVTKSFPPSPHGLGSRGASLQPQHWLTPGHCRPPAASTLSLVAVPGKKNKDILNMIMLFSEQDSIIKCKWRESMCIHYMECVLCEFVNIYYWRHCLHDTICTFWELYIQYFHSVTPK